MNAKKTAISITTVMMVLAIFGVAGAMAAGQDVYGTKVAMCDVDDTYRLNPLPAAQQIRFVDNNANGVCDQQDEVYLDVDGLNLVVSQLDIRLTPAAGFPAGSQVLAGNGDIGDPLTPIPGRPGVSAVRYWDMPRSSIGGGAPFLNGLYDLSDPVYIDMDAPLTVGRNFISINDVRLTGYSGCLPGAKVLGTDVDVGNALTRMPYTAPPDPIVDLPKCRYYDTDGNGNYNAGDHVVFDARITLSAPPPFGLGSVNDIRLTPLVGCGVTYPYGKKIIESEVDDVHVLGTPNQNAPFQLRFWDVTNNGLYTSDDVVYIDVLPISGVGAGITSPGDIRLTPYGANGAGSQVILTTDPDMGKPLPFANNIPIGWIEFLDMTGDGYTPDDPVYLDMGNDWIISINDVILSEGTAGAGTPGSKVTANSPYLSQQLTNMPAWTNINYFDTNGDGWYQTIFVPGPIPLALGIGDYVFLDVGGQGYSSANDVRLTEPTFGYPFGSKVESTEDCCVDGLVPLPAFGPLNTRLMSWDITNNGYSDDDGVYLDTSNTFTGMWRVEAHDVRLTPVTFGGQTYAAGTVVKSGDTDEFYNTNFIPWNRIRYYDITNDGYTPDDPVIVDADDTYTITRLDVRLTPYQNYAAGSKVKLGSSYYNQPLIVLTAVQAGYFDVNYRSHDRDDYVYLDIFNDNFVTVNDIRLTSMSGPTLMEGDVSLNKHVTITDALMIAQKVAGLITLDPDQLKCADTTDDGVVTIADAMHIAQWIVDPDGTLGVLAMPLWESPADAGMLLPAP